MLWALGPFARERARAPTVTHVVSYLNDTKPQPTKGMINRHRMIFQFLVSREISPYHCLERKFCGEAETKDTVLITVTKRGPPLLPP